MASLNQHQKSVLMATSLSYVIVILDTSIVNVALPSIAGELGAGLSGLQWVVNAYTLAFASLLLSGGALGDRLGATRLYLGGLAVFAGASVICGLAETLPVLVAARVCQGIGAALLVPSSLMLLNAAFGDARQRAGAIGVWAGCGGVAMAAGPLVGGLLIELWGWRSLFWINLPVIVLGIGLTLRIEVRRPVPALRQMDYAGQGAVILALASSVWVLIEGTRLGWCSGWILGGMAIAALSWWRFVVIERRHRQPMLPLTLFRSPLFSASALVSLVSALVFYGAFFLLSLYFQRVRGWTPLQSGLAFLPLTMMVTLGSFISGRLVRVWGAGRVVYGSLLLYALGFVGLLALVESPPYWRIALSFPLLGLAAGIITPAATSALMNDVVNEQAGIAAGVLNAARQSGSAFGVAIFGALMSTSLSQAGGIQAAVYGALGLSLFTAIGWRLAINLAARPGASVRNEQRE
ncbi:Spectinomycin tetracycline efflux pump [Serratia quinivorans]|uniref:MFS transporter n=1 Tax=Serratia quinivorans TaxID=137545 RepID=UPI00217B77A0|nr:MFS transporter [Serratia quinivorans]CAI0804426.1 Spectinomycin tetracycline efflux pump [Serratia quinivorans]